MSFTTRFASIPHNTENNQFGVVIAGQSNATSSAKNKQDFLEFCKGSYGFLNDSSRNTQGFDRVYVQYDDTIYLIAKTSPKPVKITGDYAKLAKRNIRAQLVADFFEAPTQKIAAFA